MRKAKDEVKAIWLNWIQRASFYKATKWTNAYVMLMSFEVKTSSMCVVPLMLTGTSHRGRSLPRLFRGLICLDNDMSLIVISSRSTVALKVIPLKLFLHYQTFFWNWAWLTFMIWTSKRCNKKVGWPCLFARQRAFKMGYFYWLRVKIRITFIQS